MKIISLLNMKGGVGKSTSSLNISGGLANLGKKVLLIDFDPQANTTDILLKDLEPQIAIDQLLFNPEKTIQAIVNINNNLDLIPSSLELADSERQLSNQNKVPQHNRMAKILQQVKDYNYEYVIIDCPPIINLLTINVILVSNKIIVPIKPGKGAIKGYKVTMKNVMEIKENYEVNPTVKILLTSVTRNNTVKLIIDELKHLKNISNLNMYEQYIRFQDKPITTAEMENRLVINDTKTNVANDYIQLVHEIIKEQ